VSFVVALYSHIVFIKMINKNSFNVPFDMPCVVLSGGKSSRMKQDKSLMPFRGYDTLVEYQYQKLKSIFSDVYISAKSNKFSNLCQPQSLIIEHSDIYSPMIALQAIFSKLDDKVFIITVDAPFVTKDTMQTIINNSKDYKITLAKSNNHIHYLCGVYDTSLLKKVDESINNDIHKIGYLSRDTTLNIIDFDDDEFVNINTKDDYDMAMKSKL